MEKWSQDVRITDIYEGTGEMNRLLTAKAILNYGSADLMVYPISISDRALPDCHCDSNRILGYPP